MSHNPKGVVDVQKETTTKKNITAVKVEIQNDVRNYILKHISLNPHICYTLDDSSYSSVCDINKNPKLDIGAYDEDTFNELINTYKIHFSLFDFLSMFNIKQSKIANFCRIKQDRFCENDEIYDFIENNSKPITPPVIGEEGITERLGQLSDDISVLNYKKLKLDEGIVEIALLSKPWLIIGINGAAVSSESVWLEKQGSTASTLLSLHHALSDFKRYTGGIYFSLMTTSPNFKDINKQVIQIEDAKLYTALSRLIKSSVSKKSKWLLKEDEYREHIDRNEITKAMLSENGYDILPVTYLFINACSNIAEDFFKKWGCITKRGLLYQLIKKGIVLDSSAYDTMLGHVNKGIDIDLIDPYLFDDRSRQLLVPSTVSINIKPEDYINKKIEKALEPPVLNLWENQKYYIEVWIEKDALTSIVWPIGKEKQVPVFPSRGFTSDVKMLEASDRFKDKIAKGKQCAILYAGDLDPSGWCIYETIVNKMKKYGLSDEVKVERFAITTGQIEGLIPYQIKESDTRAKEFKKKFPELNERCYELDSLEPELLQSLTRDFIDKYFDESLIDKQSIEKWNWGFNILREKYIPKGETKT